MRSLLSAAGEGFRFFSSSFARTKESIFVHNHPASFTFGAGIALAVPFALLAGATIWTLPETKGVRLMKELRV